MFCRQICDNVDDGNTASDDEHDESDDVGDVGNDDNGYDDGEGADHACAKIVAAGSQRGPEDVARAPARPAIEMSWPLQ